MAIKEFFRFKKKNTLAGQTGCTESNKAYRDDQPLEDSFITLLKKIKDGDMSLRNKFIMDHKPYIYKVVSRSVGRFIDDGNDDELGIGLEAFNEAIDAFDIYRRSNFFEFAEIVIKRRIIDYLRKNKSDGREYPFSSIDFNESFEERYMTYNSYTRFEEIEIKEDIEKLKKELLQYGITMVDLVQNSPKHIDSKRLCIKIARTLAENEELFQKLKRNKNIPRNELMNKAGVHRRTIENNRIYIIAVSVILRSNLEISKGFFEVAGKEGHSYEK